MEEKNETKRKRNETYVFVIYFVLNTHSGIKVSGKLAQLTLYQINVTNPSSVTKKTYPLPVRLNLLKIVDVHIRAFISIQTSGNFLPLTITHNRQYI